MATQQEIERLAVVETEVKNVKADVKEIKDTQTAEFAKLNTKIDGLDKKFAAKWVQSAMTFVIGLIIAAVLTAWLAFVIIKPNTTTVNKTVNNETSTSVPADSGSTSTTSSSSTTTTPAQGSSESGTNGGVQVELPKITP